MKDVSELRPAILKYLATLGMNILRNTQQKKTNPKNCPIYIWKVTMLITIAAEIMTITCVNTDAQLIQSMIF